MTEDLGVSRRGALIGGAVVAVAASASGSVIAADRETVPGLHAFRQVDVFSPEAFRGNPLAVVIGADDLSDAQMKLFARWTNLSETTFLLRPTDPQADYRVRIFAGEEEYPFAGHPTLGTCHVWLATGGQPKGAEIVQQCGVGPVHLRGHVGKLAFEAPPLRRSGTIAPDQLERIRTGLGLEPGEITASRLLDGGLEQIAVMIQRRDRLLAIKPNWEVLGIDGVGIIAPYSADPAPGEPRFEVRVLDKTLTGGEDPVTGSFNASVARWLIGAGLAPDHYVVSQGTVLGRAGRVYVDREQGRIWIGGDISDRVTGSVAF